MERLSQLRKHLAGDDPVERLTAKNSDDVVIVAAFRTAVTKGGKGKFKDVNSDVLLQKLIEGLFEQKLPPGFDKSLIEEVTVGNVLNPGAGANEHRAAMLAAGIPSSVPFLAINRQCSSGLMAVNDVANKILVGQIACGLAAGVESMSSNYGPSAMPKVSKSVLKHPEGAKCMIPMGITNENINSKFGISRTAQDEFASNSYQKAEKAVREGQFREEIIPIQVEVEDEDDENDDDDAPAKTKTITVDQDEGPRPNVTVESLGKLRPAFKKDGSTHAGNASQVSDGAAVVLLMRRNMAQDLNLPILGKYIACTTVGVPPEIMGVGPAYAIPAVLKLVDLPKEKVTVYEINEAFAGQALYCINKVGLDKNKVNPNGGAIALGHPLGCTGARQVSTIMRELKPGEIGVTSMCIGTGMGAAAVFARE
ncbi:3-ketoacyl-CoA thiolase, peroxisomal [Komagataella phaffii CBS 7435]|uniref:acetyl-CoA C-acyltransferase n=2 Tax=Komagataella phaffii TaxID=460519 RepID=C4R2C2_KOMPG|nr:3-ketoacyl-CoA thiolase with broad chain length specificity [Komagataella phaffii GS115]AOA62336.1 GQ67_01066T0 [Komagataella phaffii]CAH2447802.1 3-ketoacyl-CoA thiolase, peroxisomal [Komagataella phaffii CBS 7435]AOA68000.1 GQ68_00323T0 [Komagataella phaffii GS115]CAY69646.1 3-ketoacyl-CoA thiolase with broad chain length specificity [Komagataella phaffii GS115]CCA37973.1 3-ketoacyl-CoA thiolase, peroxisomal [Komagataella phaffii CBS 7435]